MKFVMKLIPIVQINLIQFKLAVKIVQNRHKSLKIVEINLIRLKFTAKNGWKSFKLKKYN